MTDRLAETRRVRVVFASSGQDCRSASMFSRIRPQPISPASCLPAGLLRALREPAEKPLALLGSCPAARKRARTPRMSSSTHGRATMRGTVRSAWARFWACGLAGDESHPSFCHGAGGIQGAICREKRGRGFGACGLGNDELYPSLFIMRKKPGPPPGGSGPGWLRAVMRRVRADSRSRSRLRAGRYAK